MKIPSSYEIVKEEFLEDIEVTGYLVRHKKTKARVILIPDERDDNKVFYIGFRTPPFDSTGAPHIMEHSVLCGSDKYPIKDPFVELAKGSLNTFLNAMTYPDKTVYPVASCNDKDFQNLVDVYLDAVFHPNIFKYKEIFEQEGWHYELESPEDELKINGVVYNEMKGARSSAEDIISSESMFSGALSSAALQSNNIEVSKDSVNYGKDFFLWVKTRLIVYGGTRPDAHLQVRGEPFPLNPDGTFSFEQDLPDSTQIIPVFATDKDGDFPTTIVPIVVKRTE